LESDLVAVPGVAVALAAVFRLSWVKGGWIWGWVFEGVLANRNKRAANKVFSVYWCVLVFALCTWLNMQSYGERRVAEGKAIQSKPPSFPETKYNVYY